MFYIKRVLRILVVVLLMGTSLTAFSQKLEKEARTKIDKLNEMIALAETKGIYVEREQMTLRTAELFLTWANWDETNTRKNKTYFKMLPYYKAKADSLAKMLPNFERSEVNTILDDAIGRLSKILEGTYTRKNVPKVDYSKAKIENNSIMANGRPVFLADHVWKTSTTEFQEFFGAYDSGFISPLYVNENGTVNSKLLQRIDNKPSKNIGQVFIDHNRMPKWTNKAYKNFTKGARHYGRFDIDHPGARELYSNLFKQTIPKVAGKNYRGLGYMLFNEPSFFTAANVWNTGEVSDFTKDKFRTWLKNKHNSIDELNTLWKTNFDNFDKVTITIPIAQEKQGSPIWYDWCSFNNYRVTDWFRFLSNEIVKYDPQAKYHIKLMPWLWTGNKKDHGMDFEGLTRLCNISACDADAVTGNVHGKHEEWMNRYSFEWLNISMLFDFYKSVAPNQIIYDTETHFLSSVHFRDINMKPNYVRATYWLAHIHGLSASKNWYWVRNLDGSIRKPSKDYPGTINQQPAVLNEMHATLIDLNSFSYEITNMQQLRKPLRIYYSLANDINRKTYMADVFENYESVFFEGIPLGFATQGILNKENPKNWDAILIRKTEIATKQELETLQSYLDQGGTVLIDKHSFKQDEYGRKLNPLKQSNGKLVTVNSLDELRQLSKVHVTESGSHPAISIKEENVDGAKTCVWRCIKNEKGNYVVSIVNLGKKITKLDIQLEGAEVTTCTDMINGIKVSSTPKLKPQEVYFVEVTQK